MKRVLIRMKKISIDFPSHQLVPLPLYCYIKIVILLGKTRITCHAGCFGFSSRGNLTSFSDNTTCHRMCKRISVFEASANIKNI